MRPRRLWPVSPKHDAALKEALNISTVRELGTNKYIAVAAALAALESKTG